MSVESVTSNALRLFCFMEKEIWKDVLGFEGLYQVSSYGRVKSLNRSVWSKSNKSYSKIKGTILKLDIHDKPYAQIGLSKDGKIKKYLVHRLVALNFIPNSNLKLVVNHKDENKLNNKVENLEWVTQSVNINHGLRNKKVSEKLSKAVVRIDSNENIKIYDSAMVAEIDGFSRYCICFCCKGKTKSHKNYKWMYLSDYQYDTLKV